MRSTPAKPGVHEILALRRINFRPGIGLVAALLPTAKRAGGRTLYVVALGFVLLLPSRSTTAQTGTAPPKAANPKTAGPKTLMVAVEPGVQLEVVDWGGTGRPLIFLAGLGNTAHTYDTFAPQFADRYHVYGITRRGFGASGKPAPTRENYGAVRLGDDVLAVMETLKLDHPVLVGHSLAGEELSSVGSRHPERVAGLVYLDAGYGYAFYDRAHGDAIFDFFQLQRLFNEYAAGAVEDPDHFMDNFTTRVSRLDRDLKEAQAQDPDVPFMHAPRGPGDPILDAIHLGAVEFSRVPVPILAIFACPHNLDHDPDLKNNPKLKAELVADNVSYTSRQAKAFAAGIPTARVVLLPNADHYVYRSNEADVVREMNVFLDSLR